MNHTVQNLQIRIHKVDGAITTFIQNDTDEIKKILANFHPARIFGQDRFVITDGDSITSLPVSKITRIDLVTEQPSHLIFPVGIVDAVELSDIEFETLVRNPMMRDQWEKISPQEDSLVTFLDLEMADGQRLQLTTEMHIELQSEALWNSNWFPLEGPGLCFRVRSGGVAVLNLANLVSLTFFPKPVHTPEAWHARQLSATQTNLYAGGPPPIPYVPASKTMNFQNQKLGGKK